MSGLDSPYITSPIEETDTKSGFSSTSPLARVCLRS